MSSMETINLAQNLVHMHPLTNHPHMHVRPNTCEQTVLHFHLQLQESRYLILPCRLLVINKVTFLVIFSQSLHTPKAYHFKHQISNNLMLTLQTPTTQIHLSLHIPFHKTIDLPTPQLSLKDHLHQHQRPQLTNAVLHPSQLRDAGILYIL